jgi:hypothetical protein
MIVSLAALRQQPASPAQSPPEFADGDPRKLEPISLEQQKKRAKELLRDLRMKNPEALTRWGQSRRGAQPTVDTDLHLNDAQLILAREHGFGKWTDFKAHIERARIARAAVEQGQPTALDADRRTLHIRCGNDIQHKLAIAGFVGDFLAFPDPYVQGPVLKTASLEEFVRIRAEFLAGSYSLPNAYSRLAQEYAALERACEYSLVTLWFEHDSYDQLILARLLDYFSDPAKRPTRLQLISVTHFPGVKIFNGLGQLPPEALRVLWGQFADVTESQFALGRQTWEAITAPTPEALVTLIATDTPALPTMAIALKRHLQELPATENGLSLTEQLTLQILADKGTLNAARLFGWYTNHYEPLTFWGDLQYWLVLSGLAEAPRPALTLEKHSENPKDWQVNITPLGHDLLANKADWLALNPVRRWVGGVRVDAREPSTWRFAWDRGVILQRTTPPTAR